MAEMYQPTLVIGLGGTGKKIILALKKMIAENSEHGLADFPFLKMISMDTDKAVPPATSSIKTIKDDALTLNPNKEVFQLQAGFGTVPDFNDYPEIKEWFPDSLKSMLMPAELAKGAGQKKPVGRFTFAWNASDIYEELNSFIRAPVDAIVAKQKGIADKLSNTINVFICGSICGGTGSGTFLDTAYLVRYLSHINGNGYQVKIFGLFALASMFDGVQGTGNVRQNCYASLVELDHFMNPINYNNPYRTFYPAYKNWKPDYSTSSKYRPFDYPFLFDNFGKKVSLNSSSFTDMAARFIYLLTGHELSDHWFSMDSNVEATMEQTYKRDIYNKAIKYRSMGTFSILYPKRMIVQLCAYNLSKEYLNKVLDDSYAPQEIENLAKRFLKDLKLDPTTDQLENAFDIFNEPDGFTGSFTDYIESQISDISDQEITKSEIAKDLLDWKKDIDEKVIEYRNLNSERASKIRENFLAQLEVKLNEIIDLHEHKFGIKKDSNGNDLADRGSLVRAEKLVEKLITVFTEAQDKYRRKQNETDALISNLNGDFETALQELEDKADGFFANKKKLDDARENVLNICRDLYSAKKQNLICNWIHQLFTDILWNEVPKYPGLIKELETYRNKYRKAILTFQDIDKEINKFLENNRRFEPNPFFDVIFDYDKDVIDAYKKLIDERGEDFIFGELSDELMQEDKFGKTYINAANKTAPLVNIDILNATEKFFFDPIKKVNISDRILETPEICDRLENGVYYQMANIYLGIESSVLDKVGLDFNNSTFFAISIPDEYQNKPCANLKGVVRANGANTICPMEQDPEHFAKEPCPMYNKCLKQKLLRNAPANVAITPTSEISEINIMHTIAGYPLCSVSSVMNNCKAAYTEQKKRQAQENESIGSNDEVVNMFGPMKFDDLDEKSIDPKTQMDDFRKKIMAGIIAKRIKCQALSIDFVTERDLQLQRIDNPSLHLGNNMNEVMVKFQSSRLSDKTVVSQFVTEIDKYLDKLSSNEKLKDDFGKKAKKTYEEFKKELPVGFVDKDLNIIDSLTSKYCGFELIDKTGIEDDMYIIN